MRDYYFTDFVIDLSEFALKKYKYVAPGQGSRKRKGSKSRSGSKRSKKGQGTGKGRSNKAIGGKSPAVMIEGRFPFLSMMNPTELKNFVEMAAFIFYQSSQNKTIMTQIMELV